MENILLEIEDFVAKVILNRPDALNSFNREMALSFQAKLDECAQNDQVRVIYLTGSGKGFCAGQDIKELTEDSTLDLTRILEEHYNPIIKRIREIEKPVVCGVNGVAAGAGANLALACDITVATKSSYFVQAFSQIGLIPDSGGTYVLPRLIGWQRASALMMLAEKVSAEEAVNMGMIYKFFPDRKFEIGAMGIVNRLAALPPKGLALTKRALNYSLTNDLEKQLAIEEQLQATAGQSEDYQEGILAFIEKRPPVFKGK